MSGHSRETVTRLRQLDAVRATLSESYVDRDEVIRVLMLAAVCHEHLLLIGPSGTAKTDIVKRFNGMVSGNRFHALLTRFTEPAELFGPLDVAAFTDGKRYHIHTEKMLPTANIAFLDEIFQASAAILNALHTLLNERIFLNGSVSEEVPLLTLVGAANNLPDDASLVPFADRFLLRVKVRAVAGRRLHELLDAGARLDPRRRDGPDPVMRVEDLMALRRSLDDVRLGAVQGTYEQVVRDLLAFGVTLSDRRIVRGLKLVAGAALLRGADRARPADLWPLYHFWSDPTDEDTVRKRVEEVVVADGGGPLFVARPPDEIVAQAEAIEREVVRNEPGALGVGAALTRLARLRSELRRDHPAAGQEDATLARLIQQVFVRLDSEE